MLAAIEYLARRDIDHDGLLEQDQNEDWMDTALRDGKVVYSQSSWILALKNLSILMFFLGRDSEGQRLKKLADDSILSIERILWSDNDACYIDLQKDQYISDVSNRTLTQDVSLYLVAVTENLNDDYDSFITSPLEESRQKKEHLHLTRFYQRAIKTLEALRKRIWKNEWPLVTEIELRKTGPWVLKPNQYHNHTFWPWITGIEMLARSRFNRVEECNILLSKLASELAPHTQSFYEWIDPTTSQGNGAFPFRTGISAIRIAISDILQTDKI
jgi:glycogen debranching enzyme